MQEKINWMRVNFPGETVGSWVRVKICPLCGGKDGFGWHITTGNFKCWKGACQKAGTPYDLGYKSSEILKKDFSPLEKQIWKYRKVSGKSHRLKENIISKFNIRIQSIKFKSNISDVLCFCTEDGPAKWLSASANRSGWSICPGKTGLHILNKENIDPKAETIYFLAGEWDLLSFYEYTGIHGIILNNESSINSNNFQADKFEFLQGKHVVIMYDNDTAGRQGNRKLARAISTYIKTKSIKILDWSRFTDIKAGCDIDDYFQAGGTKEKLFDEIEALQPWETTEIVTATETSPILTDGMNSRQLALFDAHNYIVENFEFRYNIILAKIQYRQGDAEWIDFDDRIENKLYFQHLASGGTISKNNFSDYINQDNISIPYDHFKEFFNCLPNVGWEDFSEIDKLIRSLNIVDTELSFFKATFTKWLILCYLQATEQGRNEFCLVLCGDQWGGKTSLFRQLAEPLFQGPHIFFHEGHINANKNDSIVALSDNFLISLDELENTTKYGIAGLKSLITAQLKNIRRPYARRAETIFRRASFCGSINDGTGFLTDHTGNRRWLVFSHGKADFDLRNEIDFTKLWAEVKSLHDNGNNALLTQDEIKNQNELNEKYLSTGTEYDLIEKHFEIVDDKNELFDHRENEAWVFYNSTEIADFIQDKTQIRVDPYNVSKAMTKLGAKSEIKRTDGKTKRGYYLGKR
jgi:hypothetical protein